MGNIPNQCVALGMERVIFVKNVGMGDNKTALTGIVLRYLGETEVREITQKLGEDRLVVEDIDEVVARLAFRKFCKVCGLYQKGCEPKGLMMPIGETRSVAQVLVPEAGAGVETLKTK